MTGETPDVAGTVRAYRTWRLRRGGLRSRTFWSPSWDTWGAPLAVASCPLRNHEDVPVTGCTCGLYACTDPGSRELSPATYGRDVLGVVECSGPIVFHEKNSVIRVQRAQVTAVCLPQRAWFDTARYPGVRVFRDRADMLAQFPPAVPAAPLPPRWRRTAGRYLHRLLAAYCVSYGLYDLVSGSIRGDWADVAVGAIIVTVWAIPPALVTALHVLIIRQSR